MNPIPSIHAVSEIGTPISSDTKCISVDHHVHSNEKGDAYGFLILNSRIKERTIEFVRNANQKLLETFRIACFKYICEDIDSTWRYKQSVLFSADDERSTEDERILMLSKFRES